MLCLAFAAALNSTYAAVVSSLAVGGGVPTVSSQSNAISVEDQLSVGASGAYAYGNIGLGILRATASGDNAGSMAQFNDYVTFNSGANGVGYLDWVFSAKVSPGIVGTQPLGPASVGLYMQVDSAVESYLLTNGFCPVGFTSCASERGGTTSFTKVGSIAFNIAPGPFYISAKLSGGASSGGWMDASNTGRFFLRTPEDVSYTSQSGAFLINATPVNATPVSEPGTSVLLMCGGMLLLVSHSRRTRHFRRCGDYRR